MRLSELRKNPDLLAEELEDPEFRALWKRTALARAIANTVVAYRLEHGLSQTALADRLGMRQPALARLEAGEHNPSLDTLMRLSCALDLEIVLAVFPARREPKLVTREAQTTNALERLTGDEGGLLIAAGLEMYGIRHRAVVYRRRRKT